ncbi:MAG: hypothetical protein KDD38_06475 [Bdellovibrionales bacterium]|nr:hypothetical protein [Bdellovibrionales bacterium]
MIGSPKSRALIDQYKKDSSRNDFLKLFKAERGPEYCPIDAPDSALAQLNSLNKNILTRVAPPKIKLECIKASMKRIPKVELSSRSGKNPYSRRGVCTSDSGLPKWQNSEPCMNSELTELVQWSVNKAIECGNALALRISGLPLDPEIFFQKINNESAFGFHLQNNGGIGIGQLTSIAMKEISRPSQMPIEGPPRKNYIQAAQEESACSTFKSVLNKDVEFTNARQVRHCQLLWTGNGLARNLFYSIMTFIHNRSVIGYKNGRPAGGVRQIVKAYGITDAKKINYLTLISYGRNGLAKVAATIETMSKDPSLAGVNLNTMPLDQFLEHLEKMSPYLKETRNKMNEFLDNYQAEKNPSNQTGALCVE